MKLVHTYFVQNIKRCLFSTHIVLIARILSTKLRRHHRQIERPTTITKYKLVNLVHKALLDQSYLHSAPILYSSSSGSPYCRQLMYRSSNYRLWGKGHHNVNLLICQSMQLRHHHLSSITILLLLLLLLLLLPSAKGFSASLRSLLVAAL